MDKQQRSRTNALDLLADAIRYTPALSATFTKANHRKSVGCLVAI